MRSKTCVTLAVVLAGTFLAPGSGDAQRVSFHGFVTQGYASASDYPIYGITTEGTGDYRTAALQARLMATDKDHFVVQLSHQRLGESGFMAFEDDVALDWLFYQRRLWGNSIRVGKLPMARGLFNEVRDVGVILPFFRASKAFYSEGVETIEGASISRSIDFGDWTADVTAFSGNFDIKVEITGESGLIVNQSSMEKTYGGQVVVSTPIPGVRAAGSYMTAQYKDSDQGFDLWTASVDGSFDRIFVRGEYEIAETTGFRYGAWYAQGGVRVWGGLWINGQAEFNTNTITIPQMGDMDVDAITDYAIGFNYKIRPKVVLKGEWHDFEGYQVGVPVNPFGPPVTNDYFIFGMAVAF